MIGDQLVACDIAKITTYTQAVVERGLHPCANWGNYTETYGLLGAVMILLLWFYISGLVILVGAEMNAEIEHASPHGKDPGEKVARQKRRIPMGAMRRWTRLRRAQGENPPSANDVKTALSDRAAR